MVGRGMGVVGKGAGLLYSRMYLFSFDSATPKGFAVWLSLEHPRFGGS